MKFTPIHIVLMAIAMSLLSGIEVRAEVLTRDEAVEGRRRLTLENDLVRMVVLPDPGGTVIEFTDKKTNTNFVAGGDNVLKGRLGFGWKDYYWLEALDKLGKGVFSLPYQAEFRSGPDWKAIFVSCEAEGQRFEREMRLKDGSAELTTLLKITNIGDKPRRLQCRWHTYSTLDDVNAENSCIIAPGGPGFDGEIRKCFIGSGYDHQFITGDGYWLAANYKNGSGLWMTFKKQQSAMQITWTDYNYARKGATRGMFIAEPHPQPILAQPGQSVAYESTFFPFTAQDKPQSIPLGMLSDPMEQQRARQFLTMVLPNLAAIGPFTMTPGDPPAGLGGKANENRFSFSHRRRDRVALRPWGILDAMMAVPGVQDQTIRCRYYARLFDSVTTPTKVSFHIRMTSADGKVSRVQTKEYTIDPSSAAGRELDVRDDVAISDLPDGNYQFALEGFVENEKEPIHTYIDNRPLVRQRRLAHDKMMAEKAAAPLAERPFVAALRKIDLPANQPGHASVPIGVEEGGGIARKSWPVRCGVPFAQGMAAKDAAFDLLAPDGKAVPLQSAPMATWMDGSLKWLQVDFPADVPANGHVFYTLKSKPGRQAAQPPATHQPDAEKVLGLFGPQDLWWEDGAGQKYYFRLQGDNAGQVVEENGAVRTVTRATGWYYNEQNRPVCMGELRLERYGSKSFQKLYHTVTYAGDPWKEKLGSYGIRFQLPPAKAASATVELDGKAVTGKQIVLFQRNADGVELTVDGKASQGARAIGAVALGSASLYHRDFWQMAPKKLEVDSASGTVTFSYWPKEAGAMSFLPREDGWIPSSSSAEAIAVGMSRTHEFVINVAADAPVTDFEKLYSEPVIAVVPPRYLAQTKAMMHLAPYDPDRQPVLERVISDTIDHFQGQRELFGWYGEWYYGGLPNFWSPTAYNWLNFGRYAWILNEQDVCETPWLCYMRSGDRKYLKFAEINTRHLMDVATIRWNPVWPRSVGLNRRHHECIWLGNGDTGHSMLDPLLDCYYATGYRPARDAAERMAGAMAQVSSGSWRYISNPIAGLSRMYLDTQNPFYKEHADRMWNTLCYPESNEWWLMDHGNRMVMWYSQINPQCKELWKAWSLDPAPEKKGRFGGVDVLTALYLETGDAKYAQAAAKLLPTKRLEGITQYVMANLREWCYAQPPAPGSPAPGSAAPGSAAKGVQTPTTQPAAKAGS